ncbi:hypothetical protein FJTKL_04417 [Diaporthe vaccinii]|uniref:Uncharacterized protein n=1 Tax=Diaporthe vaccinii TaxID=105482 RepID=A0ABR4DT64_9PEZI
MIQNFERAVPCYNTFFRPIYPHLTSSRAVRVSTSIWASKRTQYVRSEKKKKHSVFAKKGHPGIQQLCVCIQCPPTLFNHKPRKASPRKTDSYGHKGAMSCSLERP